MALVLGYSKEFGLDVVAGLARVQSIANRVPKSGDSGYLKIKL